MDEFIKAVDHSENFHGKNLNEAKKRRLDAIATLVADYLQISPYAKAVSTPPVSTESNAFVTLIQPLPAFIESKEARDIMASLISNSDSVMVAGSDAGLSMSFGVEGIWEE